MSEKYRLIKHNENLAEICNNENVGLLFLVDEDCERKLRIIVDLLNEQQSTINKQEEIIKSQDMEISRQYNLCLTMSGVLREEFGVYDVFDRTKDRKIERDDMNDF